MTGDGHWLPPKVDHKSPCPDVDPLDLNLGGEEYH